MKIFIYVGSNRGQESKSLTTAFQMKRILESKTDHGAEVEIFHAAHKKIDECKGCCACFFTGNCPLDAADDMALLKDKMKSADGIIFISPVYLHHVSGAMKTFIDRISYWAHLFGLMGKMGLIVSVSSTNGNDFVEFYLEKVQHMLGIHVAGKCSLPLDLMTETESSECIEAGCEALLKSLESQLPFKGTQKQEFLFKTYKEQLLTTGKRTSEYDYWEANQLFTYNSFVEAFQSKRDQS